jgi:poly(A) polymerase
VLNYLEQLTKEFVYDMCKRNYLQEDICKKAGGKVLTYGSYNLGVHSQGQ